MNFEKRISNLIQGGSKSPEELFIDISYVLTYEFKWSYQESINTPIPYVMAMLRKWQNMKKEEKKAMKKRR